MSRRLKALLLGLWLAFGMAPAMAAPAPGTFADAKLESRARDLQRQLRCLVCQGESIDESNAPLAADLRALVRRQIAEGKSDDQIRDYLVARYGDFILMKPPVQPNTYFLWLGPVVVLLGAGAVAAGAIARARRRVDPDEPATNL
jgi:cytochrome c-type biogenesis protein CcmH